jgi:hypothetical protein
VKGGGMKVENFREVMYPFGFKIILIFIFPIALTEYLVGKVFPKWRLKRAKELFDDRMAKFDIYSQFERQIRYALFELNKVHGPLLRNPFEPMIWFTVDFKFTFSLVASDNEVVVHIVSPSLVSGYLTTDMRESRSVFLNTTKD